MLLAFDAGNTHVVIGVCQPHEEDEAGRARWLGQWRISTDVNRTEHEYAALLYSLMTSAGLSFNDLQGMAASNVVPSLNVTLSRLAKNICGGRLLNIDARTDAGIAIAYKAPEEVGPDRIVNALAAYRFYGGPAVVVDYGTATTFDAITADGVYLGGAISPGIGISVEALARHAARLSRIELVSPSSAIGENTIESMRSGIVLGFVEQTDGMVRRFRDELGGKAVVIATGGQAEMIASRSQTLQYVDPWLTLEGLRMVWNRLNV